MPDTQDYLAKAATCGAVGALAMEYVLPGLRGQEGALGGPLGGLLATTTGARYVPVYAMGAIAGASASLGADLMHDAIFPAIAKGEKYQELSTAVAGAAIGGGADVLAMKMLAPQALESLGWLQVMGVGALAEVAGGWLYTAVIRDALGRAEKFEEGIETAWHESYGSD